MRKHKTHTPKEAPTEAPDKLAEANAKATDFIDEFLAEQEATDYIAAQHARNFEELNPEDELPF